MLGAEAFTVLAILEAKDRASAAFGRVDASINEFAATALRASEEAKTAGGLIDQSLLQTASTTDAVDLASAKLTAARSRLTLATYEAASAERSLANEALSVGQGGQVTTDIMNRQTAAAQRLAVAERELQSATAGVAEAERIQAATARTAAATDAELAAAASSAAAANTRLAGSSTAAGASAAGMKKGFLTAGLVTAAAAGLMVKAAGDFESSTVHLVTDAGESAKNLKMVQDGILHIASATGSSATELSNAMYRVESAGYHGAAGLEVLRIASEGARVGNANFDTVAKTLTGTLNSYSMSGKDATSMMNQLIETTAQGDLRMQDLSTSLASVVPVAAAAHLSFAEVGGAVSVMTAQNMTAYRATMNLGNTIRSLQNPTAVAIQEMAGLGLNATEVSKNLGKRGLSGTLEMLTEAILKNMKGGDVLMKTMKESKFAMQDAQIMMVKLPDSLQAMAKGLLNGTVTAKAWNHELIGMSAPVQNMGRQFLATVKHTSDFNNLLRAGGPHAQSYTAALAKMLGGATGLNTALMLTGGRMEEFKDHVNHIEKAAGRAGDHVHNWEMIQSTFNQKLDVFKATVGAAGIQIGTVLLPAASKIVTAFTDAVGPIGTFVEKHKTLVGLVASVAGGMAAAAIAIKAVAIATKLWAIAQGLVNTVMAIFDAELAVTGIPELIILIAGLVAGIIYCWNHFKTFRDVTMVVFNAVKTYFVTVFKIMKWELFTLVDAAMAVWHGMVIAWNGIVAGAKWLWMIMSATWNAIVSVTMTVWNAISGFFKKWWPLLLVIFAPFIALLVALWNHFHDDIWNGIKAAWNGISKFLTSQWHMLQSLAKTTWNAIKAIVVAPVLATWALIQSIWGKISPYVKAQWGLIKAGATAAWNGIKSSIINPVMSAWHSLTTLFGQIKDYVVKKMTEAWTSIKSGMSKWTEIGRMMVQGMINGLKSSGGAVIEAAKNVANSALEGAKKFLGISSPSKKFKELGGWVVHGLVDGLTGSTARVKTATTRLAKDLWVDFGSTHKHLQDYVAKESRLLLQLARQRDDVANKLKAANKKLADLKKDWVNERNEVASSIMQGVSVVASSPVQGGALSIYDVIGQMEKQSAAAQKFAKNLAALKKKGLRTDLIQQIAAAGVEGGGETAAVLANASAAQIKHLNDLQNSTKTAANTIGTSVADSMYGAGIKAAEGLVKGLKKQESAIEKQMLKIAKAMQKAIKRALGIKSPSTVMADEVGQHIPTGVAMGIEKYAHIANNSVTKMARDLVAHAKAQQAGKHIGAAIQPGGAMRYAGSPGGGGGTVIFDLRGTQIMSDKDMDKLVDKLGRQVATRILPAGGVRITM